MPTALRVGPYRFYFFSNEGFDEATRERPHIHVDRERMSAKFWIDEVSLARNRGFGAHELRNLSALVAEHRDTLLEAWHGHFGTQL